jgi:RNA polymerase sigma factor (TIGR02999 family)
LTLSLSYIQTQGGWKQGQKSIIIKSLTDRSLTRGDALPDAREDITALLAEVKRGRKDALDRLLAVVYGELRRIARNQMRREREGHTLQPTALVHEAFLRLVNQDAAAWQNRAQFFGVAAQLMRRLLVDHARRRRAAKRGIPITLDEALLQPGSAAFPNEEILAVDQALDRLARLDARQASVVELRYFGGLSVEETAEVLGVAERTVKLDWAMAKGWMKSQLSAGDSR